MFPAMVAPVVGIDGVLTGIHATFLRPDGTGKADFTDSEFQRETRGVIRGGAIRLAEHDPDRELLVAEGIETTLSAMEIFELPGWSVVCASSLKTVELPSSVQSIVIAADRDRSGAGQRNALAARERWTSEGRAVRLVMPPVLGTDFNDILLERRM
jgi:putative DNA primase/helicase